ncbi:TlpA family protein disulfide reductase [Flavivirga spongiicola]|uniref:TlpA family protein disulfide reductase n=1 Tax=Flavivirga spongiicola TaxID=421621 RepID=A0ABU7XP39_9FLAO|nr:TlpA disulfide reductase family protein [Flavivirga sp. MEBiC05379]MDO5977526.1 TlpA disulfide reductase family protein [Flavivirga sp. MEBiC05379]
MSRKKISLKNIIFLIIIAALIIPQTRLPIQIMLHKGLALFGPSVIKDTKQANLTNYNWKLKGEQGAFNFEETKGKVVLVNFWATWCPPCIAEMPSMQALYNDYKDRIEFIFVSNEDDAVINQFLNKNNYTFKVYNPLTKYPESFDVTSIPRTFLIDKQGDIVIDKGGAANWNSDTVRKTIDDLLKE